MHLRLSVFLARNSMLSFHAIAFSSVCASRLPFRTILQSLVSTQMAIISFIKTVMKIGCYDPDIHLSKRLAPDSYSWLSTSDLPQSIFNLSFLKSCIRSGLTDLQNSPGIHCRLLNDGYRIFADILTDVPKKPSELWRADTVYKEENFVVVWYCHMP